MTRVQIQSKTTATGTGVSSAVNIDGGIDIGAVDFTLVIEVLGLDAGCSASFTWEDTVDTFVTPIAGPDISVSGQVGNGGQSTTTYPNAIRYSWKKHDYPGLRLGVTSAQLRLNLSRLTGSSPHVTYQAWLEY
jgi:hypothetical protein